jgi:tetratricopeptide (TPR) repeat protein
MNHDVRRLSVFAVAILFGLAVTAPRAIAAGDSTPSTPPSDSKNTKKKKKNTSQQEFLDGYRAARALALDGQYAAANAAFQALGQDESPEVANYVGYTYRKMGQYDLSKVWYERALALAPNHVRTWQYYGQWQVESGNILKAKDFLEKIRSICGNADCQEYKDLQATIDGRMSY